MIAFYKRNITHKRQSLPDSFGVGSVSSSSLSSDISCRLESGLETFLVDGTGCESSSESKDNLAFLLEFLLPEIYTYRYSLNFISLFLLVIQTSAFSFHKVFMP